MISSNSKILTGNYTIIVAKDIKVGDQLLDADLNVCTVTMTDTSPYKNKLRILSFDLETDFCFSEASTFFVRRRGVQTFWVDHPAVLMFQIDNLKLNSSVIDDRNKIVAEHDVEFATIDGWHRQQITDVTERYLDQGALWLTRIETDSYAPIFVNDYLYIPKINDSEYDYNRIMWPNKSFKLTVDIV